MTTYYVGPGGSDTNAGTSWASRWLTIGKALSSSGIGSGDTVYIAPGVYREAIGVEIPSPTTETFVIADVDGSHTSGTPGVVRWTAFLTNDSTAPGPNVCVRMNGRNWLTFEGFVFEGGNADNNGGGSCFRIAEWESATATNITFRDCQFISHSLDGVGVIRTPVDSVLNWTFERCLFLCGSTNFGAAGGLLIEPLQPNAGVERDVQITIKNCLFLGTYAIELSSRGAGTGTLGGVRILNNTFITGGAAVSATSAWQMATAATRVQVKGNLCINLRNNVILSATATTCMTENYNVFWGSETIRSNVSVGANSIDCTTNNAFLVSLGYELLPKIQMLPRPFLAPLPDAPHLWRYSTSDTPTPPTTDVTGRPRPAGGSSLNNAAGYAERHDTAAKETTVIDAGSAAIRITGPGDQDIHIPVENTSTTITIKVRFDSNHGVTTRPQAILLANDEIGVTSQTITATGPVDTWETLTFSAFTPTAKGWVTVRLRARPAAANGIAYFDTVTVT